MTPDLTHLALGSLDRLLALFGMLASLPNHPALAAWASGVQGDIADEIVRRTDEIALTLGEHPQRASNPARPTG